MISRERDIETDVSLYHKVNPYKNHFSQIISCLNLIDLRGKSVDREIKGSISTLKEKERHFQDNPQR